MRHSAVRYAFLLSLLPACGGSDDDTPRTDDGVERPLGETEGRTWADPLFLVGKAWALELNGDTIREHCEPSAVNPAFCAYYPTLVSDSTAATLVIGLKEKGNDQWEAVLQWQNPEDDAGSEMEAASEAMWEEGQFDLQFNTPGQWMIDGYPFAVLEVEATGQHKAGQSNLQLDRLKILMDNPSPICLPGPTPCADVFEVVLSNLTLAPLPGGLD